MYICFEFDNLQKVKNGKHVQNAMHYKASGAKFETPDFASRTVSGYFAAFNIIDSDQDIIRKGAFAKSISERGPGTTSNRQVKYLHQHNITEIAGPLLDLFEDDYGLGFKAQVESTPLGDVILERYSNGTYKEHSFGFRYVSDKCSWIDLPAQIDGVDGEAVIPVFECKELNLFEGSVVTFGANSQTPFTGFKGSHEDLMKQLSDELEFLISKAPNFEYEYKMRQLYAKQYSLVKELAGNTKEESKPKAKTLIDYDYLSSHLKL
jgi:HK97 family phage prohead protease